MAATRDEHVYGFNRADAYSLLSKVRTRFDTEDLEGRNPPIPLGSGAIFLTPSGGIAARSGSSSPWTPGSANCTLCELYDDSGTTKIRTTDTVLTVFNMAGLIGGNKLVQAKLINGEWFVDVDPC